MQGDMFKGSRDQVSGERHLWEVTILPTIGDDGVMWHERHPGTRLY
jgi:hypothetical protein